MLLRLFLLFSLIPLVEVVLLAWIAQHTNWMVTLALIFVPGLLGAWLARHEGIRCLRQVRDQIGQGKLPAAPLLDGLLILVAAVLLITPGVLTDVVGFALLLPPVRHAVRRGLSRRLRMRVMEGVGHPWEHDAPRDRVIDVEVIDRGPRPT